MKCLLRSMVVCASLLSSVITVINAEDCKDVEVAFEAVEGSNIKKKCSKWSNKCNKIIVSEKCPITCGTCPTECVDIKTLAWCTRNKEDCVKNTVAKNCLFTCGKCSDTDCVDFEGKFPLTNGGKKKECADWSKKCDKPVVHNKCPVTCSTCSPETSSPSAVPCADSPKKFKLNGNKVKCKSLKKKSKKNCKKAIVKTNCPKMCGICGDKPPTLAPTPVVTETPSASPTSSPSASPTSSPSASPTSSPSASPTSSPSASPTSSPSNNPTELECTLTGTIEFPETNVPGYHASSLRVARENWNTICSKQKTKTNWGCVHVGEAEIGNWPDEGLSCNEIETVTIEDAEKGVYEFTMQHIFDDWELYYQDEDSNNEGDDDIVGVLTISVNGVNVGEYNYPKNKNKDTHTSDKFINGEFKDMVFVDVTCDDKCNCTPVKRLPTCHIRAEVRHPSIVGLGDDEKTGYMSDAISVTKRGQDSSCSKLSSLTKWCVHEGNAEFYHDADGDDTYDISSTESIVIPEAVNGTFTFSITRDIPSIEEDYVGGPELAGEVHLFTNYEEKATSYTHWFGQGTTFSESFFLDVECDDQCKCKVRKREELKCKIIAEVEFLEKDLKQNYGFHNDYVTVQKSDQTQVCQWENNGYPTNWGCLHDGYDAEIVYLYDKETNTTTIDSQVETARISNGAGGKYRFILEHYTNDRELEYPDDHKLFSTMSITINDEEPQSFSYPSNKKIDTHLPDGTPNPAYRGKTNVDVVCNSLCGCTMKEHVPRCEIVAELSFPESNAEYYEYNADTITVTKDKIAETCDYFNPVTEWGCVHYGDAFVQDYYDNFYDKWSNATINIPDATDSTFTFLVEYWGTQYDSSDEPDKEDQSELTISVKGSNGGSLGTFKHIRNTDSKPYNPDGTINEEYSSDMTVTMMCDKLCSCEIVE